MSWFSILPPQLATLETWLIRTFLLLALLTIGPWLLFLAYDFLLYLIRTALFELPYFGGRAHGDQRPQLPSLSERPDGRPRTVSLVHSGNSPSRSPGRNQSQGSTSRETAEKEGTAVIAADVDRKDESEGRRKRNPAYG